MPRSFDGTFQASDHGLTVTAHTRPGDDCRVHVCLSGEIDMAAVVALSKTVDWLTALAPVGVLVDLAELTFAGATLPNFVARVRQAVPDSTEIILWRAGPATRWVLRVTDMAAIASLRDEPTEPPAVCV